MTIQKVPLVTQNINNTVEIIEGYSKKIDDEETNGLLGAHNSTAYRVHEIERHLHNREKWFGLASAPDAEVHRADRMAGGIAPFALLSGNDDFGSWVQILGSGDTPVSDGSVSFDAHRYLVTTTDSTEVFVIQLASGESAGLAAKILAEEFTENPYISATNNADSGINDVMSIRVVAGTKVWARVACIGKDAKTINFYFGIHEYEG